MAKRTFKPVTSIDEALAAFVEGARIHHAGIYVDDNQMALDGLIRTKQAAEFIDTHSPTARDILIPFLDHEEDIVQITAASALIPSRLDLALKTIRKVHATSITEAFASAALMIAARSTFGDFVMGLCSLDPRFPPPGERPQSMIGAEFP